MQLVDAAVEGAGADSHFVHGALTHFEAWFTQFSWDAQTGQNIAPN